MPATALEPSPGLRCLVVDDGPADLAQLVGVLRTQPAVAAVATAPTGRAALQALRTNRFDVAFIEVALTDLDGVELAWTLKRLADAPEIVFVTREADRAAEAFDLGALDYVTKPSRRERLVEAVRRAVRVRPAVREADPDLVPVTVAGTTRLIRRSTVRWARAQGDYVRLYTPDGSYLIRAGIAALAEAWRHAGLVRIHRSYLVALRYVSTIRELGPGHFVVDVAGHQLPVSRRQAAKLRGWLVDGMAALAA
jgi:DNA-binding LytR/AlgR family response regulator